ncbi:hotdog domain-containing protein [Nocardia sp. R16R-3T]
MAPNSAAQHRHSRPENVTAFQATRCVGALSNFLRAVRFGYATASARPLHAGRSFIVVETEIHDAVDELVAKVTPAQAVL